MTTPHKAHKTASKTATLNARIDADLKDTAERIMGKLELTPSDVIRMLYRQIALRGGLPFDVCIPNPETSLAIAELDAGGGEVYSGTGAQVIEKIRRE